MQKVTFNLHFRNHEFHVHIYFFYFLNSNTFGLTIVAKKVMFLLWREAGLILWGERGGGEHCDGIKGPTPRGRAFWFWGSA